MPGRSIALDAIKPRFGDVIITLGDVSRRNVLKALGLRPTAGGHGTELAFGALTLINSYHCSRLNTNTGRLTTPMFEQVFERARALIGEP